MIKATTANPRNFRNIQTLINASINGQEHINGAGEVLEDGKIFYILNLSGTGIIIKDKDDNTIRTFQSQIDFSHPLEFQDGFKISGTTVGTTFVRI